MRGPIAARVGSGILRAMSQENVEVHRRLAEAFNAINASDVEAFITLLDPRVEYHSVMTVPGGAAYHGHDGVRRYFRDFGDAWGDEFRVEPEAFFDLGQDTLMFYVLHGRGRQSGAEVAMPGAQVCRWRDGLLVYGKLYVHREDALRDLGVSADMLEEITP
jgi:ketosteroid isomerase-like protein